MEEAEADEELLEPVAEALLPEAEAEVLLLPPVTASQICCETVWVSESVVSCCMRHQTWLGWNVLAISLVLHELVRQEVALATITSCLPHWHE